MHVYGSRQTEYGLTFLHNDLHPTNPPEIRSSPFLATDSASPTLLPHNRAWHSQDPISRPSATIYSSISITWRPLSVPHVEQTVCGNRALWHCGCAPILSAVTRCVARRESLRA